MLLQLKDVLAEVGVGKTTLYRLIGEGKFPRPVKVGQRSLWRKCDIERWVSKLK